MLSKNIIITIIVLIIAVIAVLVFFFPKKELPELPKETSEITNEEIIELLKENKDSLSYIERYPGFKIEAKTVLTKESILEGQEGPNFKEVYQDLSLEDNRYLRVDLMNSAGDKGLITIIDAKTKTVPKAFGILMIKAGVEVEE